MNKNSILLIGIIILFLLSMAVPVSGTMATATGSGVSRGDYNTLAILEAKDTFKNSEGSQYVTPWMSIAPGSDTACNGGTTLSYRYRLLAPDGTNHDQVMYQNSYDPGNGLLLSANGHFFTKNNAVKWFKVSDLISDANKKGFAWQGPWTMEYYFGDYDCKSGKYTDYILVGTKTFTLVDYSVAVTATPQQTSPYVTTVSTPSVIYTPSVPTGSFNGDWSTSYGPMFLVQSGNEITGTYDYNGKYSTVSGTLSGNVLTGTWTEPDRDGDFQFVLSADGKSFSGKWRYRGSSDWTGTWTGTRSTPATIVSATQTAVMTSSTPVQVTRTLIQPTTTSPIVTPAIVKLNTCSSTGTTVYAEDRTMQQGSTVKIPVMVCNANDLANMDLAVSYDTSVLKFRSAEKGGLNANSLFESNEASPGTVMISFASSTGASGSASIALLTFDVIGSNGSTSPIKITIKTASTSSGSTIPVSVSQGTFTTGTPTMITFDGGPVTSRDALAALQMAVGKIPIDMKYDVTKDGSVNSGDARQILKIAVSSQ